MEIEILFIYKKKEYNMNTKKNISINEILRKFLLMINENENNVIFLYKGKKLSFEFGNILQLNHNIIISVFNIKNNKNNNDKCEYIICPICYNLACLNITNNNNISLDNCINNHKFDDILIYEFIKIQKKYLESIKCDICNNDKNLYNNNFYRCSCGKNICELCLENHKTEKHYIIEYNKRYQICNIHEIEFKFYCKDCKKNICEICENCENKHSTHKRIEYEMMINKIKKNEMKYKLNNSIKRINEYKDQIDKLNEIYTVSGRKNCPFCYGDY